MSEDPERSEEMVATFHRSSRATFVGSIGQCHIKIIKSLCDHFLQTVFANQSREFKMLIAVVIVQVGTLTLHGEG